MTENQKNEEEQTTTIRIKNETKQKLDTIKIHHRETYEDILIRLMQKTKEEN